MPTRIPGCVLWLRADLGIALNGGNVSAWADQSGNGNNATQGTTNAQPAYNASDPAYGGRPTLSFAEASSQALVASGWSSIQSQPISIYLVGEAHTYSTTSPSILDSGGAGRVAIAADNATGFVRIYAGGSVLTAGSTSIASPCAIAALFSGGSGTGYVNSSAAHVVSGAAGSNGLNQPAVGGTTPAFLQGKVAEIVIYSGAHTSAQVAQLFRYFAGRYGGTWS